MATLTPKQILLEKYKNHPEVLPEETSNYVETVKEYNCIFPEEYKTAVEVLQMAEIKHTKNTSMYLCQTISQQYKEVSKVINSVETKKRNVRKKNMKELMQQSFFHGASWIGSNFIA